MYFIIDGQKVNLYIVVQRLIQPLLSKIQSETIGFDLIVDFLFLKKQYLNKLLSEIL